jgi:hypothetical protein
MKYYKYRGGAIEDKPNFKADDGSETNKLE